MKSEGDASAPSSVANITRFTTSRILAIYASSTVGGYRWRRDAFTDKRGFTHRPVPAPRPVGVRRVSHYVHRRSVAGLPHEHEWGQVTHFNIFAWSVPKRKPASRVLIPRYVSARCIFCRRLRPSGGAPEARIELGDISPSDAPAWAIRSSPCDPTRDKCWRQCQESVAEESLPVKTLVVKVR